MLTAATDMAQLRAKGMQAYGIGPAMTSEDFAQHAWHSDVERLSEESLYSLNSFGRPCPAWCRVRKAHEPAWLSNTQMEPTRLGALASLLLQVSTSGVQVPLPQDLGVMDDVPHCKVREGTDREWVVTGNPTSRPRIRRNESKESHSGRSDRSELLHHAIP